MVPALPNVILVLPEIDSDPPEIGRSPPDIVPITHALVASCPNAVHACLHIERQPANAPRHPHEHAAG